MNCPGGAAGKQMADPCSWDPVALAAAATASVPVSSDLEPWLPGLSFREAAQSSHTLLQAQQHLALAQQTQTEYVPGPGWS